MESELEHFDHVGIAVWSTDKALQVYRDILGAKVTMYKEIGTSRDYTFTQFLLGNQRIELIEPIGQSDSFLTRFLNRWGEGMHHLTFQVKDIGRTSAYLKSKGLKITDELLEDPIWKTAFVSPNSTNGVLIQLYETQPGSIYDHGSFKENISGPQTIAKVS
ncbi:MAG: VOC family protein [Thaumarchaeota archaeon]|nr:VOC family protein [Nitrososphaerota archaeon]